MIARLPEELLALLGSCWISPACFILFSNSVVFFTKTVSGNPIGTIIIGRKIRQQDLRLTRFFFAS